MLKCIWGGSAATLSISNSVSSFCEMLSRDEDDEDNEDDEENLERIKEFENGTERRLDNSTETKIKKTKIQQTKKVMKMTKL